MADNSIETALVIKTKTEGAGKVDDIKQSVEELASAAASATPSLDALGDAVEEVASAGGSGQVETLAGAVGDTASAAEDAAPAMRELEKAVAEAVDEMAAAAGAETRIAQGADKMSSAIGKAAAQLGGLKNLAFAGIGVSSLSGLSDMVDEYGQYASRVKAATESAEEFDRVQARLLATANGTYRALSEAQEVYLRTGAVLKSLGYSTEQALDVSDSLSYMFVSNAASAERAAAATNALGKALQKGAVDANAWESMTAAVPDLADKIAAATGKTVDEVRRLGVEGKLAVTELTEGLRTSLEQNMAGAEKMPATVGDAFQRLRTNIQAYLGEANTGAVSTNTLAKAISYLSEHVGAVSGTLQTVAGLFAGKYVAAMIAATRAAQKKAASARLLAQEELVAAQRAHAAALESTASTGALTAAAARLSAAQAQVAATSGVMARSMTGVKTALSGVKAFFGGPLGIALAVAGAAAAFVSFNKRGEETKTGLDDLGISADDAAKKFRALGAAQKDVALGDLKKQALEAGEAWQGAALKIRSSIVDALHGGIFTDALTEDAAAAARSVLEEMEKLEPNFAKVTETLRTANGLSEKQRQEWLRMAAAMEEAGQKSKALGERVRELEPIAKADAAALKGAGAEAAAFARRVEDAMGSLGKLSSGDLSKLQADITNAFTGPLGKTTDGLQNLNDWLDGVLIENFKRLGENGAQALNIISEDAGNAITQISNIELGLDRLGITGAEAGAAIATALEGALEKADSTAALQVLEDRVIALGKSGKLTGAQVTTALEDIRKKADQLTPGINSVEEALKELGVVSDKELKRAAEAAKEAFNAVAGSDNASLREKQEAFAAYAESAIAANQGVVNSELAVQAAQQGLTVAVDESGQVIVQSMEAAAAATRALRDAQNEVVGGAGEVADATDKTTDATENAAESQRRLANASNKLAARQTSLWLDAERAASHYAREADRMAGELQDKIFKDHLTWDRFGNGVAGSADLWNLHFAESMKRAERAAAEYVDAMEALDQRQRNILEHDYRSGVDDLEMRLLEIEGTEAQVSAARLARNKEERETEISLLEIEIERARLRGDTAASDDARKRVDALKQELVLLDRINAAEKRKAEETKRQQAKDAAAQAAQQRADVANTSSGGDTININVGGVLDVNDPATLESLSRKITPILGDLARRGAR
jgi:tape measure domain-containing protein